MATEVADESNHRFLNLHFSMGTYSQGKFEYVRYPT
jgi:hypothetical protein